MLKLAFALTLAATPLAAQEVITTPFDGAFADATFALENAIISEGLVVDHISHVGEMLNRTMADVGSDVTIFDAADVYQFCSATTSREVMEADPLNIAYCPYGIFVFEKDGAVTMGYRTYPEGPMDAVEDLLARIVAAATEF
ncbi:DUF302 domain-containing protein [Pseudooceanicola sp. C21-150M6]|uniref:DUF302 domain-containing protein n=1 Tax=Pseudooceanicola sp. C21-150M6 TaxID=3434355 RepID=UPI003D7F5847